MLHDYSRRNRIHDVEYKRSINCTLSGISTDAQLNTRGRRILRLPFSSFDKRIGLRVIQLKNSHRE